MKYLKSFVISQEQCIEDQCPLEILLGETFWHVTLDKTYSIDNMSKPFSSFVQIKLKMAVLTSNICLHSLTQTP